MLTVADAAAEVGRSRSAIVQAIQAGKLAAIKRKSKGRQGFQYLIKPSDLKKLIEPLDSARAIREARRAIDSLEDLVKRQEKRIAALERQVRKTKS